ncbi:MAG: PAC2 family protein [Candidatus Aureabacteria bacterium]|nr:PAC2 family protein [Candidatus Auribacterota bacterium]
MQKIPDVNFYEEPKVKNPVMLAAWPGMGAVATQAVDFIRNKVKATLFAEIDTRAFNVPYAVVVSEGVGSFTGIPRVLLFYSEQHDLIFCEGEEQFSGRSALKIADRLLTLAAYLNVNKIFTGAAFVQHMNHRETPSVYSVANNPKLRDWLTHDKGVNSLKRGQISGLNGSLLGFAAQRNIDAACFLSTIPIYAVNLPNPKAAKAIIEIWGQVLDFSIDLSDFDIPIREADNALAMVEEQLKKLAIGGITEEKEEEKMPDINQSSEIPSSVRKKIERLFDSAKKDKTIAHRLKEELDRWDLFREYEDRFLDLFRENQ